MNKKNDPGRLSGKGQRGVIIVIVAVSLFVLIGIGALAIDIGYLYTTRSELQNVADAAALAGARYLGDEYAKLNLAEMGGHTFTHIEVHQVVQEVAEQNKAANKSITIRPEDVRIGLWDVEKSEDDIWHETFTGPDAVSVIARRDNNENSPIRTFLAGALNIHTMNVVSRKAIAALSGPSWVEEGELKTPFGLSEHNFPNNCKPEIIFSPTADSCAGWHNFFDKISASAMKEKLLGLIEGDTGPYQNLSNGPTWLKANFNIKTNLYPDPAVTPSTSTGDAFEFQGGSIANLTDGDYLGDDYDGNIGTVYDKQGEISKKADDPDPMRALFDYFRYRDGDDVDADWTATVPVYKDNSDGTCMNPNDALEIVGFAKIVIYSTASKSLNVHVDCNLSIVEGRGSGAAYGNLKGTIPNLVK